MIYTVVCTDLNDYVNWQFELLEYTWSRVNQPGKLIRLVACDADAQLPEHRHAEVIRTAPSNAHPDSGDVYVCYNRLYSLRQWLAQEAISGTILMVDADVVFRKPLKREVEAGKPVGQHWLDYAMCEPFQSAIEAEGSASAEALQAVTWPLLIDADDLRALLPRWIETTVSIREQTHRQECDMYGFLVSAKEHNLEFELATTTAFMPWPDEQVAGAPIIHYCQKVEAQDGTPLWGKVDYQPWQRVSGAARAALPYCRDLLALVDEFARLQNYQLTHAGDLIFIGIASYCEPELLDTIQSCLEKARYPQNLRFGICHQFDDSDAATAQDCLDGYSQDRRFRFVTYDHTQSTGGSWARNIVQQLYNNETYTLQIDAHTQMIESWDTILIEMLNSLPSRKAVITQFPPLYTIENGKYDFESIDDLSRVNTAVALEWVENGWLNHTQKLLPENNQRFPRKTRFLSGAFVFTTGEWNSVVRQDDKHFYTGEEFALTVRSFTHGYDLYDPSQIVAWHRCHPEPNRKNWHDNPDEVTKARHQAAIDRLKLLLDGDPDQTLGRFGLGSERSLADYHAFSGIDCIAKTVDSAATSGSLEGLYMVPDSNTNQSFGVASDQPVDITIHREGMEPLLLACYEDNPVLLTLFSALRRKSEQPDDVIYLDLGGSGESRVFFKQSQLLAIETTPTLSDEFFAALAAHTAESAAEETRPAAVSPGFNDEWKIWIWDNIRRGCSKDDIFQQLLDHGFDRPTIIAELNHEPGAPLKQAATTFRAQATVQIGARHQPSPIADKLDVDGLDIYTVDNFLNSHECAELSDLIHSRLRASTTVALDGKSGGRHSQTCFFDFTAEESQLASEVAQRISKLMGLNPNYAEPIQAHVYDPGEEYEAHFDWFEPGTPVYDIQASDANGGQRTWSVLVYLNNVEAGGTTDFETLDLRIEPSPGKLIFWNNINPDGSPNTNALHRACPVEKGQKAVLTMWYRSIADGPMFPAELQNTIPCYTEKGIELTAIPADLFGKLSGFFKQSSAADSRDEFVEGGFLQSETGETPSALIDIPEILRQEIAEQVRPICEQWCGRELQLASIYGIRVYADGTSLKMHTDTSDTHHVSAILNIAQEVSTDWPLMIEDHMFRLHSINLNEGDMVLYEGARLRHGRPEPLNGKRYANIFIHFHPSNG